MEITENALNILTTNEFKGIGRAWIIKSLKGNEPAKFIVNLLNQNPKIDTTIEDFESQKITIQNSILKISDFMDGIVALGDKNFPKCRGSVKNSEQPVALFYKGDISLLNKNNNNVAVIGLLNPDERIEKVEQKVVKKLVDKGATIVSGLALGCDSIAHKQTINSNGRTIAILPSPLSEILPASNKTLAETIVSHGGLLVTEYYKAVSSKMELSSRYMERDRLQALFSDCVILAASYAKNNQGNDSGSRLAMGYALNYGIPRAVIYNSEYDFDSKFDLNRQYIKEDKKLIVIKDSSIDIAVKTIVSFHNISDNYQQGDLFLI